MIQTNRKCLMVPAAGLLTLCVAGCQENHPPRKTDSAREEEQPRPAPKAAPSPAESEHVDAAGALLFLERWLSAQNAGKFEDYSALYADDFSGTKLVKDRRTSFTKQEWLEDRKPMFERGARVSASGVQVFGQPKGLDVVFEQRWATSTFADVGTKRLSLRRVDDGFSIYREDMLTSKSDGQALQSPCAEALEALEAGSGRHFARLDSIESFAENQFAEVSSHEEANRKAKDGYAWEVWSTHKAKDSWMSAEVFRTSPSGDWADFQTLCFRPDGSLAEITDSHRTFYSLDGMVNDTVTLAFSSDGKLITQKHDAYLMESGKPAEAGSYKRPPPQVIHHTSNLPFKL